MFVTFLVVVICTYPRCIKHNQKLISTQCNTATFSDHCVLSCDYQNQTAILVEKTHRLGCSSIPKDSTEKSCGYGYYVYFDNSNKLQISQMENCEDITGGSLSCQ